MYVFTQIIKKSIFNHLAWGKGSQHAPSQLRALEGLLPVHGIRPFARVGVATLLGEPSDHGLSLLARVLAQPHRLLLRVCQCECERKMTYLSHSICIYVHTQVCVITLSAPVPCCRSPPRRGAGLRHCPPPPLPLSPAVPGAQGAPASRTRCSGRVCVCVYVCWGWCE
jgi:hypothetical protein